MRRIVKTKISNVTIKLIILLFGAGIVYLAVITGFEIAKAEYLDKYISNIVTQCIKCSDI